MKNVIIRPTQTCDGETYLEPAGVQSESRQKWIEAVNLCQYMTVVLWHKRYQRHLSAGDPVQLRENETESARHGGKRGTFLALQQLCEAAVTLTGAPSDPLKLTSHDSTSAWQN